MFYYPNVLQRHTGCFSTIWLAATKGIKITRRDYLSVNIQRTCNDIMDYVLVRASPIHPGLPRPRFSLYLSSQLQFGVIIVYHQQCVILLDEIHQTIDRLLRSQKVSRIDLVESDRFVLAHPDSLAALEETERALDPFFGMMRLSYELPSPNTLIEQWGMKEPPPKPVSPEIPADGITASPESITLREGEVVPVSEIQFDGVELPEVLDIVDMLLEQQDDFPTEERRDIVREELREQPVAGVSVEQLRVTDDDSMLLQVEETVLPAPEERAALPIIVLSPQRGLREEEMERRQPPRRPRLPPFLDEQMQIPREGLLRQLATPMMETRQLPEIVLPSRRTTPPAELLSNPCLPLHPDILPSWKWGAIMGVLEEREIEMEEIPRAAAEPALVPADVSEPTELLLEVSERDTSHTVPSVSRGSPAAELLTSLEEIREEGVLLPEGEAKEWTVTGEGLLEQVQEPLEEFGSVTFHSLLPPAADRRDLARFFYSLLELVTAGKLSVEHRQPYGSIVISAGPLYK
ncbi:meiotic recombination protein REC8 homolog isoform X2 [Paramormyrops kingsleyae]|uniref:Meiotic recombination protein REC8 homolog n=1 Tax=Paramormyrops kingsleyae TaxID=1676925 RepID=A0A3B3SI62_9TELE|nr:meiotic recombination protein REC8 homolog isoform X1 [Paramormyrops kingsleyae]